MTTASFLHHRATLAPFCGSGAPHTPLRGCCLPCLSQIPRKGACPEIGVYEHFGRPISVLSSVSVTLSRLLFVELNSHTALSETFPSAYRLILNSHLIPSPCSHLNPALSFWVKIIKSLRKMDDRFKRSSLNNKLSP